MDRSRIHAWRDHPYKTKASTVPSGGRKNPRDYILSLHASGSILLHGHNGFFRPHPVLRRQPPERADPNRHRSEKGRSEASDEAPSSNIRNTSPTPRDFALTIPYRLSSNRRPAPFD